MKRLLVLRPEPGNGVTVERAKAMGLNPVACPLFITRPVAWTAPDPHGFDALLLTSANALRHGAEELQRLVSLPALAVGPVTAEAARSIGLNVTMTGSEDVASLLDAVPGTKRLLHLTGADHRRPETRHAIEPVIVYASLPLDTATIPSGQCVALVHSPRAGARLAALAPDRGMVAIAAISHRAAAACGLGWAATAIASEPNDSALLAVAARLCQY